MLCIVEHVLLLYTKLIPLDSMYFYIIKTIDSIEKVEKGDSELNMGSWFHNKNSDQRDNLDHCVAEEANVDCVNASLPDFCGSVS